MRPFCFAALFAAALLSPSLASATPAVARMMASPTYEAAVAELDREHDRIVADIVTLTEIPAPPFKEKARATAYMAMLRAAGLIDVEMDAEGNVMGLRRGSGPAKSILNMTCARSRRSNWRGSTSASKA